MNTSDPITSTPVPYWRLSGFYFFYFASLGVLVPYWSLYLKSLGFDAKAIGELIAIILATKIVAPYIWGWIADHSQKSMHVIRVATILSVVTFTAVFVVDTFWMLALVMMTFSFFWNAALPQFEATTLNHLQDDVHRYSTIRLWGSLGFILMVVLTGKALETTSIELVPKLVLVLFVGIMLVSFCVSERATVHVDSATPIFSVLKNPSVITFLLISFLMLLSHGPYYTFYTIYLEDMGYSRQMIGILWAVGVVAEVVVFLMMPRLMPALGVRRLLLITFTLAALRWLLIGTYADSLFVLLIAQLFHAASFGVFHAVCITLVHSYFTGVHQVRGQALYSSLSFGAGGAVGSYTSGLLWETINPGAVFMLAALVACVALIITWKYIPKK